MRLIHSQFIVLSSHLNSKTLINILNSTLFEATCSLVRKLGWDATETSKSDS